MDIYKSIGSTPRWFIKILEELSSFSPLIKELGHQILNNI